uniref:Uncharacterized protein n=1 Tax=Vitis vinifera TaxID=29760 RepID=A5AY36_VITVI|nr:hypothetical protein VITISV_021600 [Vitis vinifera]
MADSSDSVSIDMETISLGGKEHLVKTSKGSVSVSVFGDPDKPALVTYPDLALNQLLQLGADAVSLDEPALSADDLADQIAEVLNFFGLGAVMCMGVTAGAYILTLFAVMLNVLYYYGMCGVVKELLLKRVIQVVIDFEMICQEVRGSAQLLDERQSSNVLKFLEAINGRPDITEGLRKLQCRSLLFVGDNSPFHSEALHMTSKLDRRYSALVEAIDGQSESKKPLESVLHRSRASLTRKHGLEVKTDKNTNLIKRMKERRWA